MWDIFENPPAKKTTGSADLTRGMENFLKAAKVLTYLTVFVIVLSGAVISKLSFIFMTSQLTDRTISYCNVEGTCVIFLLFLCRLAMALLFIGGGGNTHSTQCGKLATPEWGLISPLD